MPLVLVVKCSWAPKLDWGFTEDFNPSATGWFVLNEVTNISDFALQPSEPPNGFFALRKWMADGFKQNVGGSLSVS
jgi:hypothetical protein